jgi:hypothetical protein
MTTASDTGGSPRPGPNPPTRSALPLAEYLDRHRILDTETVLVNSCVGLDPDIEILPWELHLARGGASRPGQALRDGKPSHSSDAGLQSLTCAVTTPSQHRVHRRRSVDSFGR